MPSRLVSWLCFVSVAPLDLHVCCYQPSLDPPRSRKPPSRRVPSVALACWWIDNRLVSIYEAAVSLLPSLCCSRHTHAASLDSSTTTG
ncbi:hypothetical protein ANCDUO_02819 [Ancylostoma duodenale]|uniref:Secreted protein n=1 Tax=Ancylostoma duodenale TaxID=51022 RepID=A0A0C2DAX5_9BILA|nr:hypothetical protein ANCDUO_02819 [Ancylostoma duodenale]